MESERFDAKDQKRQYVMNWMIHYCTFITHTYVYTIANICWLVIRWLIYIYISNKIQCTHKVVTSGEALHIHWFCKHITTLRDKGATRVQWHTEHAIRLLQPLIYDNLWYMYVCTIIPQGCDKYPKLAIYFSNDVHSWTTHIAIYGYYSL